MPKLPGVSHSRAVRAFEKAGFWVVREGKHISMTEATRKETKVMAAIEIERMLTLVPQLLEISHSRRELIISI